MIELAADAIEGGAHASQVSAVAVAFDGSERTRALTALGVLAAEGRIGADVVATVRSALDAGVGAGGGVASSAGAAGAGVSGAAGASAGVAAGAVSSGAAVTGTVRGALPR
jgi:hypothetical protein